MGAPSGDSGGLKCSIPAGKPEYNPRPFPSLNLRVQARRPQRALGCSCKFWEVLWQVNFSNQQLSSHRLIRRGLWVPYQAMEELFSSCRRRVVWPLCLLLGRVLEQLHSTVPFGHFFALEAADAQETLC